VFVAVNAYDDRLAARCRRYRYLIAGEELDQEPVNSVSCVYPW